MELPQFYPQVYPPSDSRIGAWGGGRRRKKKLDFSELFYGVSITAGKPADCGGTNSIGCSVRQEVLNLLGFLG